MPVFHTTSETKPTLRALTSLHFTSLEEHDINQHFVTFVQTIFNVTTSSNKIRYRNVGGLYRKYTNEGTKKFHLVATAKKVITKYRGFNTRRCVNPKQALKCLDLHFHSIIT